VSGGILDVSADAYHRDEIDERPSLSKSVIHTLINSSPLHAWTQHPRLNPNFERVEEDRFDVGNCAHSLFLEGVDKICVVPFDSWRSKDAKEQRDVARGHGLVPLLPQQAEEAREMVAAVRAQCDSHPEGPFFTDAQRSA
jgi:hypothetical protein